MNFFLANLKSLSIDTKFKTLPPLEKKFIIKFLFQHEIYNWLSKLN